jgi:hypothetical protein
MRASWLFALPVVWALPVDDAAAPVGDQVAAPAEELAAPAAELGPPEFSKPESELVQPLLLSSVRLIPFAVKGYEVFDNATRALKHVVWGNLENDISTIVVTNESRVTLSYVEVMKGGNCTEDRVFPDGRNSAIHVVSSFLSLYYGWPPANPSMKERKFPA